MYRLRCTVQYEYFDAPGALRHMTLHAAADPARGRALYALHLPADRRCLVWVVNPARGGQRELSGAAAERAWAEAAAAEGRQGGGGGGGSPGAGPTQSQQQGEEREVPAFEVAYVRSQEAALKQVQKELGRIRWEGGLGCVGAGVWGLGCGDSPREGGRKHPCCVVVVSVFVVGVHATFSWRKEVYALPWPAPAALSRASQPPGRRGRRLAGNRLRTPLPCCCCRRLQGPRTRPDRASAQHRRPARPAALAARAGRPAHRRHAGGRAHLGAAGAGLAAARGAGGRGAAAGCGGVAAGTHAAGLCLPAFAWCSALASHAFPLA